jgi:endonuclease G, mitochondrial
MILSRFASRSFSAVFRYLTAGFIFVLFAFSQANAQQTVHLTLGNPTKATASTSKPNNFLLIKPEYVLSYNRSRGGPNWVSWHLDRSDLGAEDRSNNFRPDADLPATWRIPPTAYRNTGYDRGHLCPSGDRTTTHPVNSATFVMSNMLPQEGDINRFGWAQFEIYVRSQIKKGREAYIIAGGYGTKKTIFGGRVSVPTNFWKIVVFLPEGDNDISRINMQTKVVAIDMPNEEGLSEDSWREYLTSVDQIQSKTGYDFLSEVPLAVQNIIEARTDPGKDTLKLFAALGEGTGTRGGRTDTAASVTSIATPTSSDVMVAATTDNTDTSMDEDAVLAGETDEQKSLRLANEFDLPEPASLMNKKTLWATNYYVYGDLRSIEDGIPLLDTRGRRLGPQLSAKDWCLGGIEGTFRVTGESGEAEVYNFAGTGNTVQVDCSPFIRSRSININALGRSRYKVSKGAFGEGVNGMILVPFRTIAVDRSFIPYGTVIYIPQARGVLITLPSGEKVRHDGYFFAADTGGAIKQNHIDVFTGISRSATFKFVQSNKAKTFEAYVINDTRIIETLKNKHSIR